LRSRPSMYTYFSTVVTVFIFSPLIFAIPALLLLTSLRDAFDAIKLIRKTIGGGKWAIRSPSTSRLQSHSQFHFHIINFDLSEDGPTNLCSPQSQKGCDGEGRYVGWANIVAENSTLVCARDLGFELGCFVLGWCSLIGTALYAIQ